MPEACSTIDFCIARDARDDDCGHQRASLPMGPACSRRGEGIPEDADVDDKKPQRASLGMRRAPRGSGWGMCWVAQESVRFG